MFECNFSSALFNLIDLKGTLLMTSRPSTLAKATHSISVDASTARSHELYASEQFNAGMWSSCDMLVEKKDDIMFAGHFEIPSRIKLLEKSSKKYQFSRSITLLVMICFL